MVKLLPLPMMTRLPVADLYSSLLTSSSTTTTSGEDRSGGRTIESCLKMP